MNALSGGLVVLINGILSALNELASPLVICGVITALALLWLCLIELDDVNRLGTKPIIGRH